MVTTPPLTTVLSDVISIRWDEGRSEETVRLFSLRQQLQTPALLTENNWEIFL